MADPLKLTIGAQLPGEALAVEILRTVIAVRETMDADIRKRWDAIWLVAFEDAQKIVRRSMQDLGIIAAEVKPA